MNSSQTLLLVLVQGGNMRISATKDFLQILKENNIFQKRTGMSRGAPEPYTNRWKVGDELDFCPYTEIEQYSTIADGNIIYSIGSFSSCASQLPIGARVGRYTEIATGLQRFGFRHPIEAVTINSASFNFSRENINTYIEEYKKTTGHDITPSPIPIPQPQKEPILIGNDVWIGKNVTIKGGVTIGDGAVIASESIITKDVPSYTIVGGSPAKLIKKRFPTEICEELIKSQWWNLELGDLYREELDFSDPSNFLKKLSIVKNNIRKFDTTTFSPALYKAYGFGVSSNSKKIITHHGTPILYNPGRNALENKKNSNNFELKLIDDNYGNIALRTSEGSFISIDNQGNISLFKEIEKSAKAINIKNENKYIIASNDGKSFLSANKSGFKMKQETLNFEKFIIV